MIQQGSLFRKRYARHFSEVFPKHMKLKRVLFRKDFLQCSYRSQGKLAERLQRTRSGGNDQVFVYI